MDMYVVDAFTHEQFKGNSAAIVPVDEWPEVTLMQNIAIENNLSETAFIKYVASNTYEIRWFSPLTEIDFCGHATLAASFILFSQLNCTGEIKFITRHVGDLSVNQKPDGRIEMLFPNLMPNVVEQVPSALSKGLSFKPNKVLRNQQAYVVILDSEQAVKAVEYDSQLLAELAPYDVVVSAKSETYDFVSRYFWPANGGDEDPVTGSIHASLAPYWAKELGKSVLVAHQASQRGGILYCELTEQGVLVSGFAVLYLVGQICL